MLGPDAKTLHLAATHHAPAQRAHHFPERDACRIDAAAGRLVAGKQLLARSQPADGFINSAEAPGIDADPAEVFHGIAEVCELPVQYRAHAVGADDEIAMAKIDMHQRPLLRRTGV